MRTSADDAVVLTVFNPAPYRRDEVVTAVVDLPASMVSTDGRYSIARRPDRRSRSSSRKRAAGSIRPSSGTWEMRRWRCRSLRVRLHMPLGRRARPGIPDAADRAGDGVRLAGHVADRGPNTMENALS